MYIKVTIDCSVNLKLCPPSVQKHAVSMVMKNTKNSSWKGRRVLSDQNINQAALADPVEDKS